MNQTVLLCGGRSILSLDPQILIDSTHDSIYGVQDFALPRGNLDDKDLDDCQFQFSPAASLASRF